MGFIKNFEQLATTPQRKIVLELIETALESIQPDRIISSEFRIQPASPALTRRGRPNRGENNELTIKDQALNLTTHLSFRKPVILFS